MAEATVRQLVRYVEPLAPTDTLGKAVEVLRRSGSEAAPVIEGEAIVGLVTEATLLRTLRFPPETSPHADPVEEARTAPVGPVADTEVLLIPDWYSLAQAAHLLESRAVGSLPVVDEAGRYRGMIQRRELIEALNYTFRPLSVGGMATPLGVYLSTGNYRAGAGDLGLMLTGMTMGLLFFVGHWLVFAGAYVADSIWGGHWSEVYLSPYLASSRGMTVVSWALDGVTYLVFFALIRMIPLSGYHGAEHQVVHTLERGGRLEREFVRTMPRAHPRCGTNLAAFMIVFFFLMERFNPLLALAVTLPLWRFLGRQMQQYFTTKPATDKQLDNGMRVGAEILAQYHQNATFRPPWWRRFWYTGLVQVLAGMAVVWGLGAILGRYLDVYWRM